MIEHISIFVVLGKSLIVALMVMAVWATMWEENIFEFVRLWGETHLTGKFEKLQKPIYDCPICQTPWYGSIIYWVAWGTDWREWLFVLIIAMGFNVVLIKLFPEES